jgi:hypothetical protein
MTSMNFSFLQSIDFFSPKESAKNKREEMGELNIKLLSGCWRYGEK